MMICNLELHRRGVSLIWQTHSHVQTVFSLPLSQCAFEHGDAYITQMGQKGKNATFTACNTHFLFRNKVICIILIN